MTHFILGVHVTNRLQDAMLVQKVLTDYGHLVKTRLGLHEIDPAGNSPQGLLLLELIDDQGSCKALADKLGAIEGIEVQQMVFTHPTGSR